MPYDLDPNPVLDPATFDLHIPKAKPIPAPRAEPEHHWEGPMHGEKGAARRLRCTLVLHLSIREGRIAGSGHSPEFPYSEDETARHVEIVGALAGDRLTFEVLFTRSRTFKNRPFRFSGVLHADGERIFGTWTHRCETCNCDGSEGTLELTRVEDE
ncbi:MAG: hypothetical protein ACOYM8_18735 [Caulobacterales bacterium]